MKHPHLRLIVLLVSSLFACCAAEEACIATEIPQFGFGRRDITPTEPMRLSGFTGRTQPATQRDEKLQVRSMVMKSADGKLHAIVSVDLLGLGAAHTATIARQVEHAYAISRERLAIGCTHTHTGPQLDGVASNILEEPLSEEERKRAAAYAERVIAEIVGAIGDGVKNSKPGKLFLGEGSAGFAVNRRVLENGKWKGFGVNPDGPVDRSLPVLKVTDVDGKVRGLIFNYACHATTFNAPDNRFSPDWPGYAALALEEANPGAVVLSLIGCGADANPFPRSESKTAISPDLAIAHGRAIADGVRKVLAQPMTEIASAPVCSFGYVALPFDVPSPADLRKQLEDRTGVVRRHAAHMLEIRRTRRMFPTNYPLPLQTWQFGDQLTMVFMGGEVVVDYALRLKKEIQPGYVWVTAYANDVPGYVASERVRGEAGYEVDYSMIYYDQPGRWASGTEELILRRIHEIREFPQADRAREPDEALVMFRVPDGMAIEAVATEPLVMDPINFAFGADGRLWVVEMADYPSVSGEGPIGRVVFLEDTDRDGTFDKRTVFLDGLELPSGAFPWRDGVVVSAAPEIFFARDTDGDGRADERTLLFSGFGRFNPQHRVNGFTYGLDHWLYVAGGDPNRKVRAALLDRDVEIQGSDFRMDPDTGRIEPESGRSQYGRARDDWGHWFGNDNSHPWFHYAFPDRLARRNPHVMLSRGIVNAFGNAELPPVFPTSRTAERFNDLYAANRFTSACSPNLFRDDSLGDDLYGSAFVCEPVHNLIQRIRLVPQGATFAAERVPGPRGADFLSSTDGWFRPVRVATGPDGALWVADMYRQVIEHPQYIPDLWKTQLDFRAGSDRGRIYRLYREGQRPGALPVLSNLTSAELVERLDRANGVLRDMAQQQLLQRQATEVSPQLEELYRKLSRPQARAQILWTLHGLKKLAEELLITALTDPHEQVAIQATQIIQETTPRNPALDRELLKLASHPSREVRFRVATALESSSDAAAGETLAKIALADSEDSWIRAAVLSSAVPHADGILSRVLADGPLTPSREKMVESLIATIVGSGDDGLRRTLTRIAQSEPGSSAIQWQFPALVALLDAMDRKQLSMAQLRNKDADWRELTTRIEKWFARGRQRALDPEVSLDSREICVRLLGRGTDSGMPDRVALGRLVSPQQPQSLQLAAVAALGKVLNPDVPGLLLNHWREQSPATQSRILDTLLEREPWTLELMTAMESSRVNPRELDAAARNRLLKHANPEIARRASGLLADSTNENRRKVLDDHQVVRELPGNPLRGAHTFRRKCAVCHRFRGYGNDIGANLASLQDRSADALLTAILDPNRAVEGKFRTYAAALRDGRVLQGMVTEESANSLTLVLADGKVRTLLRTELEQLAGTGSSFMPEGLEKDLTPQELADVIAFLQSRTAVDAKPNAETAARNRRLMVEADGADSIEIARGAMPQERETWLGTTAVIAPPQEGDPRLLRVKGSPVHRDAGQAQPTAFRFPVAMDAPTEGTGNWELRIVGRDLRVTIAPKLEDQRWTSADNRLDCWYLAFEKTGSQGSGWFEIELSPGTVRPDETIEIELAAKPNSLGEIGIIRVRDSSSP